MRSYRFLCSAALVGAFFLGSAGVAAAQEAPVEKETRIVVRDGGVFVDGERVADADGRVTIETEDGERVFVHREGPMVDVRREWGEMPEGHRRVIRRFEAEHGEAMEEAMEQVEKRLARLGDVEFDLDFAPMAEHVSGMAHLLRGEMLMNAEVRRMEREAMELARRARELEGRERQAAERELKTLLDDAFDARMEARREHLADERERLDERRRELDERARRKAEVVERRMSELLGERDLLDW